MRIFYVVDSYDGPHGGTEKQLLLLVGNMRRCGHDVRLFVLRHTPFTRNANDFPCPIESLDIQAVRSYASIRRLLIFRSRVARDRPKVVHAFFNDAAMLVPLFCRMKGVRIITSRRDMGFWYSRLNVLFLRFVNRWADHIVCNCQAVAQQVARIEHAPRIKLAVIYNAVSFSNVGSKRHSEAMPRPLRVCLLANVRPIKRIEDLIGAAASIVRHRTDIEFIVIGEVLDRKYYERLGGLLAKFGLADRVVFVGRSDNPAAWLHLSDIGVLTSSSEGLSNSILEYMCVGIPVVCSNVGGNRELIAHGENGYLYRVGDVEALTEYIAKLCADADLRAQFGRESRRLVRQFSAENMIQEHLRLYYGKVNTTPTAMHADG